MSAPTVAVDCSEFQPPVDDSYPHRWLTFRVCDGSYVDHNAAVNLAWCRRALAAGRLDGYGVYVVYRPGLNTNILNILDWLGVPRDCTVMVDAETWGGQISGDQSAGLNALATGLATRQSSQSRVWGYGNRSDLASMWSGRPSWLGVVVASYGGSRPTDVAHMIGWQYTDGLYTVPGMPSSSAPFGPCDHNELFLPAQGDLPMTPAEIQSVADAVWAHNLAGTSNHPAGYWVTSISALVAQVLAAVKDQPNVTLTDAQITAIGTEIAKNLPTYTGTLTPTATP
jgi:hypothetical protein